MPDTINKPTHNLRIQQWVAFVSVLLFGVKLTAWFITSSVAILTDALESIANIVAGFIGLYSLYISAKPRDDDHPYGHGKVEYISAAIEGTMIIGAAIAILYKGIKHLIYPVEVEKIDFGLWLLAGTALVNYTMGWLCEKTGIKNQSPALIASGRHLKTDTYTTGGIIAGLILLKITGWPWIDSVVAIFFGLLILITGYNILKSSAEGIMDKADIQLLEDLIKTLQQNRRNNWIDLHNLRILKYGSVLHLDCHLTVPWYLNVHEAHREVDALSKLVKEKYGESIELFVHTDGCLDFSCSICNVQDCRVRKHPYEQTITWTKENVLSNQKHQLGVK
jgi:cation diffusion facilitator family transporter